MGSIQTLTPVCLPTGRHRHHESNAPIRSHQAALRGRGSHFPCTFALIPHPWLRWEALRHPWLAEQHDPENEPDCPRKIDFDFERRKVTAPDPQRSNTGPEITLRRRLAEAQYRGCKGAHLCRVSKGRKHDCNHPGRKPSFRNPRDANSNMAPWQFSRHPRKCTASARSSLKR